MNQGTNILINSIDAVVNRITLKTNSNIKIITCCIANKPIKLTGKCIATTLCILEVKIDDVIFIQNLQLDKILMAHLRDEVEPTNVLLTLVHLSYDVAQTTRYTLIGTTQIHDTYYKLHDYEIYNLNVEKSDANLPFTSPSAKFICFPTEVNTHRKINLGHTP